jgi:hypothetical protein
MVRDGPDGRNWPVCRRIHYGEPRYWQLLPLPTRDWPPASMTYQQDLDDLAHHEAEIRAHQSFNYGLFDDAETALPGCVYIDRLEKQGADAEISWRVVDGQAGSDLQRAPDAPVLDGVPLSGHLPSQATSAATCPGQTCPPWRTLTRPLPRRCQGIPARNNYNCSCINNQSEMRKITIVVGKHSHLGYLLTCRRTGARSGSVQVAGPVLGCRGQPGCRQAPGVPAGRRR